jgi:hemolysin activation/secretion protein
VKGRAWAFLGVAAGALIANGLVAPAGADPLTPLIFDQNRADKPAAPAPEPAMRQPALGESASQPQRVAFTVSRVTVSGTSLPTDEIDAVTRAYVGKEIDRAGLQRIADALSAFYAQSDIALYTVTVPDQDFADGVLHIVVYEGYVAHVELHGETSGDLDLMKSYAERLTAERPLHKSTLQRYISLMRDIAGVTLDVQMMRGDEPGAALMSVGVTTVDHKFSFGLGDQGTSALGLYQLQADAEFYGLLREGEVTHLSVSAPTVFDRYQYVALTEALPVDSDGDTVQLGGSYLHTRPKGTTIDGHADTLQLVVSRALIRSFDENLIASVSVDALDSANAAIGNILATDHIRAVRLLGSYSLSDPKSYLSVTATAALGIAGAGASTGSVYAGAPGFRKVGLQAQYNYMLDDDWIARVHVTGQLSGNALPASELYAFGGANLGAAFPTASVFGDSIAGGRGEIAWRPVFLPDTVKGSEIYGFVDGGAAWLRARPLFGAFHESLASAGGGVRVAIGQKTVVGIEGASAIVAGAPGIHTGDWRVTFSLTTKVQ